MPRIEALAGGVSSDIMRIDADGRTFCVKRALPKLKVAAEWRAPVERNHAEAESSAARVAAVASAGACNAALIKPNQAGTLTETHAALAAGKQADWGTIVSARSGETEDVSIAHLAVGWNAGQLKVGSFARSERMAKWNEVLRLEEALGGKACYAGRAALPQFWTPRATP